MTAIDLFCGCGGLSSGLVRAGVDVVLGVDSSEQALGVYRRNLGRPTLMADLAAVPAGLPTADLFAASPPCQDFSSAGTRTEGDRAALTVAFAQIVLAYRPPWFVLENVSRAMRSRAYSDATTLLSPHYGLSEVRIDAAFHGVPQRRQRLLVVGRRGGRDGELRDALAAGRTDRPLTVRETLGAQIAFSHYYWHPRYGRQRGVWSVDEPAPTITGRPCPRPPAYRPRHGDATTDLSRVRALTLREAAAFQTFPPTWNWDGVPLRDAWQMVGNAVPVRLGEHLGRVLLAADAGCREDREVGAATPAREITTAAAKDEDIRFLNADNRTFEWPEIDLCFTDPPYRDLDSYEWLGGMLSRKLRPGRLALVYADGFHLPHQIERLTAAGLRYVALFGITYPRAFGGKPLLGFVSNNIRPVVLLSQGKPVRPERLVFAARVQEQFAKTYHPWQQAVEPAVEWIRRLARTGDLVADPFLGSGTTAVAVRAVGGLRFLGTEIDTDTHRKAVERLSAPKPSPAASATPANEKAVERLSASWRATDQATRLAFLDRPAVRAAARRLEEGRHE